MKNIQVTVTTKSLFSCPALLMAFTDVALKDETLLGPVVYLLHVTLDEDEPLDEAVQLNEIGWMDEAGRLDEVERPSSVY